MIYSTRAVLGASILLVASFGSQCCAGDFGCYNNKDGGCSLEYKINRVFKTSSDCCLGDGHWYKQDGLEECTQCAGSVFQEQLSSIHEAFLPEKKINAAASLLGKYAPEFIAGMDTTSQQTIESIYRAITKETGKRMTNAGVSYFDGAAGLISISKNIACRSNSTFTQDDFVEAVAQITHEYELGHDRDNQRMLSALGKIVCIDERGFSPDVKNRRRRRKTDCLKPEATNDCECPDIVKSMEDIHIICTPCQFYSCLQKIHGINVLDSTLGLELNENHCLAFVVDTSASMLIEINAAVNIITEFLVNQKSDPWCYMLIRFHDDDSAGRETPDIIERSLGPLVVTDTLNSTELTNFYDHLRGLKYLDHGFDTNEFCFDGILKTLEARDKYSSSYLGPGSQVVVFTNAPTKRAHLKQQIIDYSKAGVCINFFLSQTNLLPDVRELDVYSEVATETGGTVISNYNKWEMANFLLKFALCKGSPRRHERSVSSPCISFSVSSLAKLYRLAIEASSDSQVTITKPNNSTSQVKVDFESLALFSEDKPEPGMHMACVDSGDISRFTYTETANAEITFMYSSSDNPSITESPPAACSSGNILVFTSKEAEISNVTLLIRTRAGVTVKTLPLSKYSKDTLMSPTLEFPQGFFEYHLEGLDKNGVPFTINPRTQVRFDASLVSSLKYSGDSKTEILPRSGSTALCFTFKNRNKYSFPYTFSSSTISGVNNRVQPSKMTVSPGAMVSVCVQLDASSVTQLGLTTITLTASDACGEKIRKSKSLRIVEEQVATTTQLPVSTTQVPVSTTQRPVSTTQLPVTTTQLPVSTTQLPVTATPPNQNDKCGNCLNGGTCFSVTRHRRTRYRCVCPPQYAGALCQVVL